MTEKVLKIFLVHSLVILILMILSYSNLFSQNLVHNPGFEEGEKAPDGWFFWTRTTGAGDWDEQVFHSGKRSVKIVSSQSNDNWSQRAIPLKPGYLYRFSVWVRQERCYAWGPDVVLTAYDANDKVLQSWEFRGRRGTRDWYPLEGYFVPPQNTVKASIELRALFLPETVPVWFDDVSLEPIDVWTVRREVIDPVAERDAKFRYLRSLSMDVISPHFQWAKKLLHPPKVFFAIDRIAQREIVELAQRFGFPWQTVFITSDPNPRFLSGEYYERLSHEELREAYRKVLSEPCDVIVLSGSVWDALGEEERQKTVKKIEQGTALVYVGKPWRLHPEDLLQRMLGVRYLGKEVYAKTFVDSPLLTSYPESLPSIPLHLVEVKEGRILAEAKDAGGNRYPLMVTKTFGNGRILFLTYRTEVESAGEFRGPGLTPMFSRMEVSNIHFAYHEYLLASFMKWLLYASQPERWRIESAKILLEGDWVKAVLSFPPYNKPLQAQWFWRDKFSRIIGQGKETISPTQTQLSVVFHNVEKLCSGDLFFEAIFADGEAVIDWSAVSTRVEGVNLTIHLDKNVFQPDEPISGKAEISQLNRTKGYLLKLQLFDCYGWEWERLEYKLSENQEQISFNIPSARIKATGGVIIAKIVDSSGKVRAEERKEFVRASKEAFDDWRQIMWTFFGRSGYRPYLWGIMSDKLHEMGIDTWLFNISGEEWHIATRYDFKIYPIGIYAPACKGDALGMYASTRDKKWLIREPCMSSPEERERLKRAVSDSVNLLAPYSPIAYCLTDESNVTYYNAPFDFCFSPFCLERMRNRLRELYPNLSTLNDDWGKKFNSWDEVLPDTFEEALERRNFLSWAHHREFMDGVFVDIWRQVKEVARKIDPRAKISLSGTPQPEAYGGYDWFSLLENLDALLPYLSLDVGEMQRSFSKIPRTPWAAGYGIRGADLLFSVWRAVFNQCTGIAVFNLPASLEPDLTFPKPTKDFIKITNPLVRGLGKLLIHASLPQPLVAIHHSMPSIRSAFALGLDEELANERAGFVSILRSLGIEFVFVDARQLEMGWLKHNKIKVLVLPMSLAMSEKEVNAVKEFVANGGKVIADVLPAIFDELLKPRNNSPLADIFPGDQVNLLNEKNLFKLKEPPAKFPSVEKEAKGILANKLFLANYLTDVKFRDSELIDEICRQREQWIEKAMKWVGVPMAQAQWEDGSPVRECIWATWEIGKKAKIIGVLSHPQERLKGKIRAKFPKNVKVYRIWEDQVTGKKNSIVKLWALLPKEPAKPIVRVVGGKLQAGINVKLLVKQDNAPELTVFRITFVSPDGSELKGLARNIIADNGIAQFTMSLPHNLPTGWRVIVRDVLTQKQAILPEDMK